MSEEISRRKSTAAYAVAIVGTFLIVAALVGAMRRYTQPPPLDEKRITERSKALAELRAAETQALTTPGWVDKSKGIVRLPVDLAMEMVHRQWQSPAMARSNLLTRLEKATAVPPKAPEQPSEFE